MFERLSKSQKQPSKLRIKKFWSNMSSTPELFSEANRKYLLSFIIHNEFGTSQELFETALNQTEFNYLKDTSFYIAEFLERRYNVYAITWSLVDSDRIVIPAHKLTMEQKLEIAVTEQIDLKATFVKDVVVKHFVNKEKVKNLSKAIKGVSLSE
ncbi:hypothetical protein B9Z55_027040 [Caenorhabditis nigoni]|uniref:Uncharacterized protein n=1 Tax=Caenorhabditis nigoni TaxID=1611254 RepID=A0A2G5SJ33_9PELO|nr:hypothetical protein B9Z55_027040 [Caenorhabditis nigoni]